MTAAGEWGASLLGVKSIPLVLASASPRRAEVLERLGIRFAIRPVAVEEKIRPGEPATEAARRLAEEKTRGGANVWIAETRRETRADGETAARRETRDEPCLVVGADTLVAVDGRVLGKPRDEGEARRWLRVLSGRTHEVYTGVAVLSLPSRRLASGVERTAVCFRELTEEDRNAMVESGEALDKAGAYGIQGLASLFVERIEGDYSNVVGLPLGLLRRLVARVRMRAGDPEDEGDES